MATRLKVASDVADYLTVNNLVSACTTWPLNDLVWPFKCIHGLDVDINSCGEKVNAPD